MWPLGRLIPYARNSRTHSPEQIAQIAGSIAEFGFTCPILVDEKKGGILAGHARLKAARQLGMAEVPVIPLGHLTEAQQRAYIIADNKLAENAGWDDVLLREELNALLAEGYDVSLSGFSDKELEEILDDSGDVAQGETDAEEAPALAEEAVACTGDLWLLGNHKLLVGDATDSADVAALMDGEKANVIVTDPPYNVNYAATQRCRVKSRKNGRREKEHNVIAQDDASPEQFQDFLDAGMANYAAHLAGDGSLYCFYPFARQVAFECAVEAAGLVARCHLVWAKNHFVLTFNRYKQQHEGILYCHWKGQSDAWYGDNNESTLWWEKKPQANREHPTMKPVELIERALMNSSRRGNIVADFFGGSGSTLIACERLGRKCRMMEIHPLYGDVILRRWSRFTGKQPVLAASGTTFLQAERERLVLGKTPLAETSGADSTVTEVVEA